MNEGQLPPGDSLCLHVDHLYPRCVDALTNRSETLGTLRVAWARVVIHRRFVTGDEDFHPLTLPHVNGAFRVEGSWPSPITISQGWGRATARPWNDEAADAFVRLDRGRTEFLRSATHEIVEISGSGVFSPAMFSGSMRVWTQAGYEDVRQLEVMERPLGMAHSDAIGEIREDPDPDWDRLLDVDRMSFQGFWRMSLDGLREALHSTNPSAVLTMRVSRSVVGYAIVGSRWGTSYLQRVAVDPDHRGQGLGTNLVRACVGWARHTGAASMVLNVRGENSWARRLYEREGFTVTGRKLHILRHGTTTLLN